MKTVAIIGPNSGMGGPLKRHLETAGVKAEEIEFFAPLEPSGELGMTEYDGAAEWVKSVMSDALQKARLVLLCEPLPETVKPPPGALVLDLIATLRGDGVPLLPSAGFTTGLFRLPSPAAMVLATLLHDPAAKKSTPQNEPLYIWHLASATESLPGGAAQLLDQAQHVLTGRPDGDPADLSVFNLRPAGIAMGETMRAELQWLGTAPPPLRSSRIVGSQFHCGVLLVDGLSALPSGVTVAPFPSAHAAAGLSDPLIHSDPGQPGGIRLTVAYDPFSAALFPRLTALLEKWLAEA
jgi:hypothetical protein